MAKGTHASGASFTEHELSDPHPPPVMIKRAMLGVVPESESDVDGGSEEQSVGMDSSEFSSTERKRNTRSTRSRREPVQTTETLSDQTDTDKVDSSAPSTDGGGQRTRPRRSGRAPKSTEDAPAGQGKARARTISTDDF